MCGRTSLHSLETAPFALLIQKNENLLVLDKDSCNVELKNNKNRIHVAAVDIMESCWG